MGRCHIDFYDAAYSRVGNLAILHGNIEVDTNEDALVRKGDICDVQFVR